MPSVKIYNVNSQENRENALNEVSTNYWPLPYYNYSLKCWFYLEYQNLKLDYLKMQHRSCLFLEHGIDIDGVELKRLRVLGGMEDGVRMSEDVCVCVCLWRYSRHGEAS